MTKEKKRKLAVISGLTLGTACLVVGGMAISRKPAIVTKPCARTFFRADGVPKIAYDSSWVANLQSIAQIFYKGEFFNAYQCGDKFYTGHTTINGAKNIKELIINLFK